MPDPMPMLELGRVSRRFGTVAALDGVSFAVAPGEVVCLVGHSGCGKSTLLRVIAGVEPLDDGRVAIGGTLVSGEGIFVEPEHRQVGFMFQDYALFPHLSVRQNIGFGLRRLVRSTRDERIERMLARIGIAHLADRFPHMLSGGEQQRVALARALAPQPRVLLMDEPFSNLDRGLRDDVRRETLAIVKDLGTTAIVVTHDPEEALAIGDRVALMQGGRLIEVDTGEALYSRPRTAYAAAFLSQVNRLPGRRVGELVSTPLGDFAAPDDRAEVFDVLIRPRAIALSPGGTPARVRSRTMLGEIEETRLELAGHEEPVVMRSTTHHAAAPGEIVTIAVKSRDVLIFPAGDR